MMVVVVVVVIVVCGGSSGCGGSDGDGGGGGGGPTKLPTTLEIIVESRRGGGRRPGVSRGTSVAPSVTFLQYFLSWEGRLAHMPCTGCGFNLLTLLEGMSPFTMLAWAGTDDMAVQCPCTREVVLLQPASGCWPVTVTSVLCDESSAALGRRFDVDGVLLHEITRIRRRLMRRSVSLQGSVNYSRFATHPGVPTFTNHLDTRLPHCHLTVSHPPSCCLLK